MRIRLKNDFTFWATNPHQEEMTKFVIPKGTEGEVTSEKKWYDNTDKIYRSYLGVHFDGFYQKYASVSIMSKKSYEIIDDFANTKSININKSKKWKF